MIQFEHDDYLENKQKKSVIYTWCWCAKRSVLEDGDICLTYAHQSHDDPPLLHGLVTSGVAGRLGLSGTCERWPSGSQGHDSPPENFPEFNFCVWLESSATVHSYLRERTSQPQWEQWWCGQTAGSDTRTYPPIGTYRCTPRCPVWFGSHLRQ